MANLPALLGSEASKAIAPLITKSTVPVVSNLLTPEISKSITQAATPEVARSLTQLLPTQSGSAIDGIINRNTGITLPNATPRTFQDMTGQPDLASALTTGDVDVETLNDLLPAKSRTALRTGVSDMVAEFSPSTTGAMGTANVKSNLPKIKTSDYIEATGLRGKDIPAEMRPFLSESKGVSLKDGAKWAEVFPDMANQAGGGSFAGSADDILDRYTQATGTNANVIHTPENYTNYLALNPEKNEAYTSELTNLLGGDTTKIPVGKVSSAAEPVKVSGLTTAATDATKAAAPTSPISPTAGTDFRTAQENVAQQFSTGGAGNGGGNITVSSAPISPEDYGFNQPVVNEQGNKVIKLGRKTGKTTYAQKSVDFDTRNWLDSMNATRAQYEDVFSDSSRSINKYYKNAAQRAQANGLNRANIKDQIQALLDARNIPLQNAEQYATDAGMRVNLPSIELSNAQAQSLQLAGVDLNAIQETGTATPIEAEQIYKMLRTDGNKLRNATDGASQERGRAMKDMAKEISKAIDNTMDSLGLNYKDQVLQRAADAGEDIKYLNEIAKAKDYKFSDMRADMADLMNIKDLSTNKMKAGKTFNIAGVDTGIPNPLGQAAENIKSKFYQTAAKLENAAGGGGGYTFEGAAGETGGDGLSGLLGKAKKVAPYAVGAGIGLMAAGGNRPSGDQSLGAGTLSEQLGGTTTGETAQAVSDPYETVTIGGYSYNDIENGYFNALMAGDTAAANQFAKIMEVLEKRIENTQKTTETESNSMTAGMNILNQLYDLYQNMGGAQGIVGGNVTNALNAVSGGAYNTDVSTYNQTRALTSSMLARALGEKGTLSDTDRKYINDNLPKVTDDPAVAEKKFRAIYNMLVAAQ